MWKRQEKKRWGHILPVTEPTNFHLGRNSSKGSLLSRRQQLQSGLCKELREKNYLRKAGQGNPKTHSIIKTSGGQWKTRKEDSQAESSHRGKLEPLLLWCKADPLRHCRRHVKASHIERAKAKPPVPTETTL